MYTPCERHLFQGGALRFFATGKGSRSNLRERPCKQACRYASLDYQRSSHPTQYPTKFLDIALDISPRLETLDSRYCRKLE